MKHETFSTCEAAIAEGDTRDLRRCIWLMPMKGATRSATLASLATLCTASETAGELPVSRVQQLINDADPALKSKVGGRWTQMASDVRRAMRAWDDRPTRWLAQQLRSRIPTLLDAATAASMRLGADEAKRATAALEEVAGSQNGSLGEFPATMGAIEPLLRAATPETFGVASPKSLENKKSLVRKAVRFVDPVSTGLREASEDNLPSAWNAKFTALRFRLEDHETSVAAILRRLANHCAGLGIEPDQVTGPVVELFVSTELATHAQGYVEKLRRAFRHWNDCLDDDGSSPRLTLPGAPDIDSRT